MTLINSLVINCSSLCAGPSAPASKKYSGRKQQWGGWRSGTQTQESVPQPGSPRGAQTQGSFPAPARPLPRRQSPPPGAPPPGSLHLQPVVRKAFPAEPAPPDHKSQGQPCPAAPSRSPQPTSGRLPPHPAGPPQLRADGGCQPGRCRSAARPARPPAGAALTLNDILHMSAAAPPGPARFRPGRLHGPASLALPPPSAEGRPPRRRALPPPQTGPGRVREEGDGKGRRRGGRRDGGGRGGGGGGEGRGTPSDDPLPSPYPPIPTPPAPPYLPHKHFQLRSLCAHTTHTSEVHARTAAHSQPHITLHTSRLTLSLQTEHPTLCTLSSLHTHTTLATCSTLAGNPALLLTYLIHDKAGLS